MRLDDGVLIKDNHVAVCGGVTKAVRRAKAANTGLQVQVEVDRVDQIEPALAAGADRLLLDNMPPAVLREAVALVGGRVPLEASGGVTLETVRACPCSNGCPSCVGPTADRSDSTKKVSLEILGRLCGNTQFVATRTAECL